MLSRMGPSALALQYWLATHTAVPHLHASVLTAVPSKIEHAGRPQLEGPHIKCKQHKCQRQTTCQPPTLTSPADCSLKGGVLTPEECQCLSKSTARVLVHFNSDDWLDMQYWFAAHTSSPHVHATGFNADPSVLEHRPQLEDRISNVSHTDVNARQRRLEHRAAFAGITVSVASAKIRRHAVCPSRSGV